MISQEEIKNNAIAFAKEFANENSEQAEAKTFWDAFFNVFGIPRRRVATFEKPVKKIDGKQGFIDLLWKGVILVEHKSKGKNLDKAFIQAKDYFEGLKDYELPKYILVSDFEHFRLYDLDDDVIHEFNLENFYLNIHLFDFLLGYQKRNYLETDPINIKAVEILGKLHDKLKDIGYIGKDLEIYLVRLLFCMFAEDTSIFQKDIFREYIDCYTNENGKDLSGHLHIIFDTLNTHEDKRYTILDDTLKLFPYINGNLFSDLIRPAYFDKSMREMLLQACALDWSLISPAIFGSMFQSVMNPKERREAGAHYTSEKNILKVIEDLFLNDLYEEFNTLYYNTFLLEQFHDKIASLKFLDPACGCGNFLVIAYRELRELEFKVIERIYHQELKNGKLNTHIGNILKVNVDQFYGIEYDEFPSKIAQVAMWLTDHQANIKISKIVGQYYVRFPLNKSARILHKNALEFNWQNILVEEWKENNPTPELESITYYNKKKGRKKDVETLNIFEKNEEVEKIPVIAFDYIMGNPPFIGKQMQTDKQKNEISRVFYGTQTTGVLDYVCAWYLKAAQYIQNTKIKVAFVSTNSITQGEQVGILWSLLFQEYKIKIHFAHQTFEWKNEGKDNAAVYCVIIGFANFDTDKKYIYQYKDIKGKEEKIKVKNINPYLVEGNDIFISKQKKSICDAPDISFGSMPNDGGHFLLTDEQKNDLLQKEPLAREYIRPLISAKEFLNNEKKWCVWLKDITPDKLKKMTELSNIIKAVEKHRLNSIREATQKLAERSMYFAEDRQPQNDYLAIPATSSEHRKYIPMIFCTKEQIINNTCLFIENADLYIFGMLHSSMHIAWVKRVCGRLKSDFRYSNEVVYNNFPFPENITIKQKQKIEEASKEILNIRERFKENSLANIYNPLYMPLDLVKAHNNLNKIVDKCYYSKGFDDDESRLICLFSLYEKYINRLGLVTNEIVEV